MKLADFALFQLEVKILKTFGVSGGRFRKAKKHSKGCEDKIAN